MQIAAAEMVLSGWLGGSGGQSRGQLVVMAGIGLSCVLGQLVVMGLSCVLGSAGGSGDVWTELCPLLHQLKHRQCLQEFRVHLLLIAAQLEH